MATPSTETLRAAGSPRVSPGVVAAAIAALACFAHDGLTPTGAFAAATGVVLVRLAEIDLRSRVLPNRIVVPATAAALLAHLAIDGTAAASVLGALGAGGALLIPVLLRPNALGMGDVKMAMLLGAALGRGVVPALMIAFFAAGLFAGALVLVRGRCALKTELPLGPFLAAGGLVVLLT